MDQAERIKKLESLSPRQLEVFRLFCNGSDYASIAKKLVITEGAVRAHMAGIYTKLGLSELKQQERWKEIFQNYCPLTDQIGTKRKSAEEPIQEEVIEPIPKKLQLMVVEDEHALVPVTPVVIKPPDGGQGEEGDGGCLLPAIGIATTILLTIFVLNYFGLLDLNRLSPTLPTETSDQIAAAEVTATLGITPDAVPQGVTQITPAPTSPPEPSATIQPTESALFQDNFDNGLSPSWQVLMGNPVVVNGMLTADQDTWLYIPGTSWTDYEVSFTAEPSYCWLSWGINSTSVHMTGRDEMVDFQWAACETVWYTVSNGSWSEVPNTQEDHAYMDGAFTIVFRVEGSTFTVYIDGIKFGSIISSDYPSGGVGLRLTKNTSIDNFRVTEIGG